MWAERAALVWGAVGNQYFDGFCALKRHRPFYDAKAAASIG